MQKCRKTRLGRRGQPSSKRDNTSGDHDNPVVINCNTDDVLEHDNPVAKRQTRTMNIQKTALGKFLNDEVQTKLDRLLTDKSPR